MDHSTAISHRAAVLKGEHLSFEDDVYKTVSKKVSWFSRTFPSIAFYRGFFWNLYRSSAKAKRGRYGDSEWSHTSYRVLQSLESVGVELELTGVENIRQLESPCVFISNHMSMFESMIMPAIIRPVRPVTFIVKQSLLRYPFFRHVLQTRDPIAVSRDNPREDLKTMLREGGERLKKGISVVVFPQTTRSLEFDADTFNTSGVKLARRANVPVIPVAVRTDAWGIGKWFKDLGPIDPGKRVHIAFGEPIAIHDRGAMQQASIVRFIREKLTQWSDTHRSASAGSRSRG